MQQPEKCLPGNLDGPRLKTENAEHFIRPAQPVGPPGIPGQQVNLPTAEAGDLLRSGQIRLTFPQGLFRRAPFSDIAGDPQQCRHFSFGIPQGHGVHFQPALGPPPAANLIFQLMRLSPENRGHQLLEGRLMGGDDVFIDPFTQNHFRPVGFEKRQSGRIDLQHP